MSTEHRSTEAVREWYDERAHLAHEVYKPPHAQRRMETIKGLLDAGGKRVLDLGCGLGQYAEFMGEQGAEVVAVDISQPTLDMAAQHPNVTYLCAAAEELADLGRFDLALCTETMEHLRDPQACARDLEARADQIIASVPISEAPSDIGWARQGHLHTFRLLSFAALFSNVERSFEDGFYGYVMAVGR